MRDLDGECVTGVGNTRGSVILVAAPGSLISVIFDVWNVTVFLLSGLYITILISAPFWLASATACGFNVFHFLVNVVLLYSIFSTYLFEVSLF